jgi:hypothetical protein
MSQTELLMKEIASLPPQYVGEVIDFVGYLKHKAVQTEGICPLCAEYTDPETGELRFNEETLAAMREGDAILNGEIPAKRFNSFKEMLTDLDAGDE